MGLKPADWGLFGNVLAIKQCTATLCAGAAKTLHSIPYSGQVVQGRTALTTEKKQIG